MKTAFIKTFLFAGYFALQSVVIAGAVYIAGKLIIARDPGKLAPYLARIMSEAERAKMREAFAKRTVGMWTTVPDGEVARIGKANREFTAIGVKNKFNNAGMRSEKDYGPKSAGIYRIVCLGDSFVFGEGAREEERFCDQLGNFFKSQNIRVEGKEIESMAVGLGSWTMVQEANYLRRRLDAYDPDLIIVLSIANDVTAAQGVTGEGQFTHTFSHEERRWGTGAFFNQSGLEFSQNNYSVLTTGVCHTCRERWRTSISALKALIDAQIDRRGRILLSVLNHASGFPTYFKDFATQAGINVPILITDYFRENLPHDSHPSYEGHRILATHYLHALNQLGWVSVPDAQLPKLDERLSMDMDPHPLRKKLARIIEQDRQKIPARIDFSNLRDEPSVFPLLGGFFPTSEGLAWASLRSGFVLKGLSSQDRTLRLDVELPEPRAVYPFTLSIELNGADIWQKTYSSVERNSAKKRIELRLPDRIDPLMPVDVVLYASDHFETLTDHRMRSFQVKSAELVSETTAKL